MLRGFHYQDASAPQWRLVRCSLGEIFDVVVDLRPSSATYGKWLGVHLSAANRHQLLIPPEFAHGFCVLSEFAEVQYKCSNFHSPSAEHTLAWMREHQAEEIEELEAARARVRAILRRRSAS